MSSMSFALGWVSGEPDGRQSVLDVPLTSLIIRHGSSSCSQAGSKENT